MTMDELNVAMALALLAAIPIGAFLQFRCVQSERRLAQAQAEQEALQALGDPIV